MSICSIEDIRSVTKAPFWFQLYVFRDRGFSESVIERAKEAGCTALFLTVDLPLRGQRHCDIKNGLSVPPRLTARNAFDIMTKPRLAGERADGQAQVVRQYRRLSQEQRRHLGGRTLGQRQFRQVAVVERRRPGSASCGRASWSSRAFSIRKTPSAPPTWAPTASSCPIMAAGSSTARRAPSPHCRASPTRCATASKCCSMAASARDRTC